MGKYGSGQLNISYIDDRSNNKEIDPAASFSIFRNILADAYLCSSSDA